MLLGATFLFFSCILFVSNVTAKIDDERRIVALGDLHGSLANTLEILKFSGLIDNDLHWIGGDAIFVQTGDVLDRGLDTIKLYELIQNLRDEAPLHGGLVIPLLGNHEIMNLVGDWRYVYPDEVETFGGFEARKLAFKKDGFIGQYLTLLNMTTKVGSTVFCHGGITPFFSRRGIDWINDQTHESIIPYMESHGHYGDDKYGLFGGYGPTWYRGYALDDESKVCDILDEALELLEANRMVVGHTVQHDGAIHTRCGGKVILIDIGISNAYGGRKGALEIRGNNVFALYADRKERLPSPPPYIPLSERTKKQPFIVHEEL
ncbi:Metallo-dependent phosphatase-like protein [Cokeromyces recurvatus]|uniref:Metallo-dependent phosphatase-like protein n=1 Tax=Cokeromyces recurvatus TaxID=90255 RepID=UPI00221FD758|nr:Metallo-dependent phosphatase-like protein [Cokeromyces recurvatus]KAI7902380.1 Metallo-dependent phosphatase-like protein [Cokeromyces recurvatus]